MANNTILNIAKNIKFHRKKLSLSQAKLSIITGISPDYLSEIERGKTSPSVKRLCMIAEALGVEPYKLLMNPE